MFDQTRYGPIEKPHVSVIIPVYNEENCIKDCITSLLNQDFKPIEILTVDDGSTDSTIDICEELRIKAFRQDHKGPGAARNLGARNAKGDILIFIDADMVFAPDYVSMLIEPIIKRKAIATCHWNERVANWDNSWARCQTWFLKLPDKRRQPLDVAENESVYRAVRKDFFLDSGGFNENEGRADDSSIARNTGVMAKIVPDAICYHKNVGSAKELFNDANWHGRNMAAINKTAFKASIIMIIYNNPLLQILRGPLLALKKREPRMIFYSIIYTFGYLIGFFRSIFSKYYLK